MNDEQLREIQWSVTRTQSAIELLASALDNPVVPPKPVEDAYDKLVAAMKSLSKVPGIKLF